MDTQFSIRGTVNRITYQNDETLYTIAKVQAENESQLIVIVGTMPDVFVGRDYEWSGHWITHAQYGRQFQAQSMRALPPTTTEGIERFLASGLIRGVGPATAKKLVDAFGKDALHIIEHEPNRLTSIPGISSAKAHKIEESYKEHQHVQQLMVFLQSFH